jgi:DNA helicase-2/ATP-dependent DNA helicase PcrA
MKVDSRAVAGEDVPEESRDLEMDEIVRQEEQVLARVQRTLGQWRRTTRGALIDYDAELLALRDQIRDARAEDIPPLIEEMERLQQVANRRAQVTEGQVDPSSPYFGRMVLEENDKRREVLIGRSTFVDPRTGIRIVDWRDAPVSRVYYRYDEGDDYEECFGDRDVEGEVLLRRSLSISGGELRRIAAPQGAFARKADRSWRRIAESAARLAGGQGAAMRPQDHHRPGVLGVGDADGREDKHLSEITALIDPRQFDLITMPTSGLVVIQGGAGSGKTTIGLHRMAYLAFQDPKRFRPDKMLVVVFNDALVRYISRVLPALGVEGVPVVTYEKWARKLRLAQLPTLPRHYTDDTPAVVVRFKKHPMILRLVDRWASRVAEAIDAAVVAQAKTITGGGKALRIWESTDGDAPGMRLLTLRRWLTSEEEGRSVGLELRHALERLIEGELRRLQDLPQAWAEVLTDKSLLLRTFSAEAPGAFTEREIEWAHAWCTRQCAAVLAYRDDRVDGGAEDSGATVPPGEDHGVGIDGEDEEQLPQLDVEDDAILLRLHQRLVGPVGGKNGVVRYEHVFIDETQDLAPIELAVVLGTASAKQSITLAGDVAQKLYMDNGFTGWRSVLAELGLDHVEIEPLKLSYRSTHEILEFAVDVLGPLRSEASGQATRHGAPVECFEFGNPGEAVGFLAEALRNLAGAEPLASIAVIARFPEQADLYFDGLKQAEVPNLRRVAEQDFSFRPGVDVTDVRQVKGLEFDYVIMVDVNAVSYPEDDESRHLLHIAATRAAHQLWVVTTGAPSRLLPPSALEKL